MGDSAEVARTRLIAYFSAEAFVVVVAFALGMPDVVWHCLRATGVSAAVRGAVMSLCYRIADVSGFLVLLPVVLFVFAVGRLARLRRSG